MQKQISSKITALTFGVLTVAFLAVFYVVAWTEPTQPPPNCPAGQPGCDAPLNVGSTGQSKKGNLMLNASGTLANGLLVPYGNVGIGTTDPGYKMDVQGGQVNASGGLCIGGDCKTSWAAVGGGAGTITTYRMTVSSYYVYSPGSGYSGSKTVSYTCPDGSTPVVTYCKSIQVYNPRGNNYVEACSCSGSTLKSYAEKYKVCDSWPLQQISMVDACGDLDTATCSTSCSVTGPCEIEFTCGKKEIVGTYSSEECTTGQYIYLTNDGACNQSSDNTECNGRCTAAGWQSGSSASCTPNVALASLGVELNQCNLLLRSGDTKAGGFHFVSCRCSN